MTVTIRSSDAKPLTWAGRDDRIASNVRNILRMWQGEAAFARPMGLDTNVAGLPVPAVRNTLAAAVREIIEEYEPGAVILDVRACLGDHGAAEIEVDIDV